MKIKNKGKIAIVGTCHPPYGGISVHIQRVLMYLRKKEYAYDFYEISRTNGYIKNLGSLINLLFKKYYLIHLHSIGFQKTRSLKIKY